MDPKMCSWSHLGWHFRMLFQSSKLKARTSLFTETWQERCSSFELWSFENVTSNGIGCDFISFMDCVWSTVRFTVYSSVCVSWNRDVSVECWTMSAKVMCSLLTVYERLHAHAFSKAQQLQLILDKLATNGTFKHQQAEWERQARMGRNQSSLHDVCRTIYHVQRWALRQRCWLCWRVWKHWQKAFPCHFSTIRTEHKVGKVHGNAVYQLNSLMETKWHYKNWCFWKECHTPHLTVITTTVNCE